MLMVQHHPHGTLTKFGRTRDGVVRHDSMLRSSVGVIIIPGRFKPAWPNVTLVGVLLP